VHCEYHLKEEKSFSISVMYSEFPSLSCHNLTFCEYKKFGHLMHRHGQRLGLTDRVVTREREDFFHQNLSQICVEKH
jgi:hypothetical protein